MIMYCDWPGQLPPNIHNLITRPLEKIPRWHLWTSVSKVLTKLEFLISTALQKQLYTK